ncbi:MAG TPA: thiamine phosphate synthase [Patescibacteria group bacterium]|nr:thiamine phosphate synthase [Patescibacteria group bacterium]
MTQRPDRDAGPGVCFVTDRTATAGRGIVEVAVAAARGGVDFVQVREKDLDGGALLRLVSELQAALAGLAGARTRLLVNDRLDVALAAKTAGVHLPASGLPIEAARRHAGKKFLIGRSVHSLAEAKAAAKAGADYLIAGPVFPTPSKTAYGEPLGVAGLERIARAVRIPVWAIGGVTAETASALAGLPLAGVAAIRAVAGASDPAVAVRALRQALAAPGAAAPASS